MKKVQKTTMPSLALTMLSSFMYGCAPVFLGPRYQPPKRLTKEDIANMERANNERKANAEAKRQRKLARNLRLK